MQSLPAATGSWSPPPAQVPEPQYLVLHLAGLLPAPHRCVWYKATLSPGTGSGTRTSPHPSLSCQRKCPAHPPKVTMIFPISSHPLHPSFQAGHWSQNFSPQVSTNDRGHLVLPNGALSSPPVLATIHPLQSWLQPRRHSHFIHS